MLIHDIYPINIRILFMNCTRNLLIINENLINNKIWNDNINSLMLIIYVNYENIYIIIFYTW